MKIKPVIMAGGQGTRLWPLSCSINPKQFLKTLAESSLLQKTLIRNKFFGMPLVITGDRHEFITKEQAAEINDERILELPSTNIKITYKKEVNMDSKIE